MILSGDIHATSVTRLEVKGRAIGLEVVSSGITASRGKRDRLTSLLEGPTSVGEGGELLEAKPAGTLRGSPNFVEIRVRPQPNEAPAFEVFFFPSVGNLADKEEQDGLANPSAYLEANPGVWASRRYVPADPATAPEMAFVGFPDLPNAGATPANGKNLLHAGASICVDYTTLVSSNPYFGNDWFSVFRGAGASCSILKGGENLEPAPKR